MRVRLPIGAPHPASGPCGSPPSRASGSPPSARWSGPAASARIVFDGMAQFAPDLILLGAIPVVVLSLLAERGLSRVEAAARRRWHA